MSLSIEIKLRCIFYYLYYLERKKLLLGNFYVGTYVTLLIIRQLSHTVYFNECERKYEEKQS